MEDTSATASTAPRRDNALLNQSLDDIIKQNRSQGQDKKKKNKGTPGRDERNQRNRPVVGGTTRRDRNEKQPRSRSRRGDNNKMMDTTPVYSSSKGIQKSRNNDRNRRGGSVVIRSNSGRPSPQHSHSRSHSRSRSRPVASSTPGLRQPWEKVAVASLPAEPLKISIRNELAEKPVRRSDMNSMMMDTDGPVSSLSPSAVPYRGHYSGTGRPGIPVTYEPRDSLASRDEYRIGNRFSTQGMTIDYQLPSGASYDTRPSRRY